MRALALHGVMPGQWAPIPRPMRLVGSPHFTPRPFRPSPLRRMGQPPGVPDLPQGATKEELAQMAAQLMIDSAKRLTTELRNTYTLFQGTGKNWLTEAAASFFLTGPTGLALDTWWQSSRQNQALLRIRSAIVLAGEWISSMTKEDGWIPQFIPLMDEIDPTEALGNSVLVAFEKVVTEQNKLLDLVQDVRSLPPRVVAEGIATFFGDVSEFIMATADTLREVLKALLALMKEVAKLTQQWPLVILTGGLIIVGVVFILR